MKLSNNETAITNTMFDFSRICRFPNVIGAADVTHVGNKSPFLGKYSYKPEKIMFIQLTLWLSVMPKKRLLIW